MGMTIDTSLLYESGYNKGFKDGIKGSIPKSEYEARLKADMVAMLTEIQLEIEELRAKKHFQYKHGQEHGLNDASEIIQQKINMLKGEEDGNE